MKIVKDNCVYVGRSANDHFCKFGKSDDFEQRVKGHRTTSPTWQILHRLPCIAPMSQCEAHLKNYFESKRILGSTEHFVLSQDEIGSIPKLLNEFERRYERMRQVEALKQERPSQPAIDPDPEAIDACRQYRALDEQIYRLERERDALKFELQIKIGSSAGLKGIAIWEWRSSTDFDEPAFRRDHPELYATYQKRLNTRVFKTKFKAK